MTPTERRLAARLRTPAAVQRWIRSLPYNFETDGETMRTFRGVVRDRTAHCLEAALSAATILERHGFDPLMLDLESRDGLDHVVFAFRCPSGWGAVGGSRDVGLWGRRPMFRNIEALARSYYEPYIDLEARITAFALVDLRELGQYDWRLSDRNAWKVERLLLETPHKALRTNYRRYIQLRRQYRKFLETHEARDTPFKRGSNRWM
ncbi:MAG: hypothetical protein V3T56_07670 [Gemmatimonadales bacterium]